MLGEAGSRAGGAVGAGAFGEGGEMYSRFVQRQELPLVRELNRAWQLLREAGEGEGALAAEGKRMGEGVDKLQRAVTMEIEGALRDKLNSDFMNLPPTRLVPEQTDTGGWRHETRPDERRRAWVAANQGRTSRQWLGTWPTELHEIRDDLFATVAARYFGVDVPSCVMWAGTGRQLTSAAGSTLDLSGAILTSARVTGGHHDRLHDMTMQALCEALQWVGADVVREPTAVFAQARAAALAMGVSGDFETPPAVETAGLQRALPRWSGRHGQGEALRVGDMYLSRSHSPGDCQ